MNSDSSTIIVSLAAYSLWVVFGSTLIAEEYSPLERVVLERVEREPQNASNWRLLAKFRRKRNDLWGAVQAYERAIDLAPHQVSIHFDLATTHLELNNAAAATHHLQWVVDVAPDSEYGVTAIHHLRMLEQSGIQQASFVSGDRDANRFGGVPAGLESTQRPFRFYAELGAQYNSNVQLAPLSRVVVLPGQGSFQGFFAPHAEFVLREDLETSSLVGAVASGSFNVNESQFSEFNLQEYLAGLFYEFELGGEASMRVLRVQYGFTLDEFAGNTFATRHSLATTFSLIHDEDAESVVAWTIDYSDFSDDGVIPGTDSLDGWTNTLGGSHTRYLRSQLIELIRVGSDLQWAPLQGDDFAYRGVFVYGQTESNLPLGCRIVLQLGWGFRNYNRFTSTPSRDENLWRAGVELRRVIRPSWELVGFYTYDRFASDNDDFDTSRTTTGIMTTVDY